MEREHVRKNIAAELYEIREKLFLMGEKVEMMINNAMESLAKRDSALAEEAIVFHHEISGLVIGIEEKCFHLISKCRPTEQDLRFLTLGMKIVTDMKRISKLCAGVANRALELIQEPPLKTYIKFPRMAHWTAVMVKEALAAFARCDKELALKVCKDNHIVTIHNEQVQRVLLTFMMEDPETISHGIKINHIAKCFEQIAGHATKIAEMAMGTNTRCPKCSLPPFAAEIRV